MANYFDQFDEPKGNYFDQFDQSLESQLPSAGQSSDEPPAGQKPMSFTDKFVDALTGESRMTPEMEQLQPVGNAPELNQFTAEAFRAGIGQLFGSDASQEKIFQSMGGKLRQDEKGNKIVSLPSGDYALNKPGLSPQDVTSFLANVLSFTPAGRATSVAGAVGRSAATDAVLQEAVQTAGGENIDPIEVATSGALGGAGKAVENVLSTISRAVGGRMSPEAKQSVQYAEDSGQPLMTTDVVPPRTFTGRSAQALAEKIPVTGTGSARRAQQEARRELVQDFSGKFADAQPDEIIQSLQRQTSKVKQAAGQRLSKINDEMQNVGSIHPAKAIEAIDKEISRLSRLGGASDNQTINKLSAYKNEFEKGADFGLLRDLRTQFRQDVKGDRVAWPNQSQAAVERVYTAMTDDIADAVSGRLGPQMANRYKQANSVYAHEAKSVNNTRLKNVLQKGELTPEVANTLLFSNKPSEVKRLYASMDTKGRSAARAAIIGKAYEKSGGSPDKFLNELNRLSSQVGIFFKGATKREVEGLSRYLDQTRRASRAGAVTPTGQELFQVAVPATVTGDIIGTGGQGTMTALSYGALAKAYESKSVRNALLRLANTPKGSMAYDKAISNVSRVITNIGQVSSRN
ncbi:hypothetical protein [Vibrio fluvialis]|uniref:hypothetical protein n=1 Tax=Vibrio fluvialis TaxID=676 RepID=UPI001EE9E801|nr:hypothetical protein [Vibrio fluvialis]MCG6365117.1 hypothetical protein [Vibrio fluvialis]